MVLLLKEFILLRNGHARILYCMARSLSTRTLFHFPPNCYTKIRRAAFQKVSPLNFYVLQRFLCDDKRNFDPNSEILPEEIKAFQEHLRCEQDAVKLQFEQTKKRAIEKYGYMRVPAVYIIGNEIKLSLKRVILIPIFSSANIYSTYINILSRNVNFIQKI